MVDLTPGAGAPSVTLSYWKDLPSLYAFAHSQSHRDVWDWWNSNLKGGRIPHLGIFHEVYAVPKGHWENIYVNYRPFGMGKLSDRQVQAVLGSSLWSDTGLFRSVFPSSCELLAYCDLIANSDDRSDENTSG